MLSKFDSLAQRLEKANLEIRDLKEQNNALKNQLTGIEKTSIIRIFGK